MICDKPGSKYYKNKNIIKACSNIIDNHNILMCGPVAPPIHGQSLSFTLITREYPCKKKYIVNQNFKTRSKLEKISVTLIAITKYLYFFTTKKIDLVYFSSSRSKGGCIKDLFLINIAHLLKIKLINHVHGADFEKFLAIKSHFLQKLIEYSYNKVHTTIVLVDSMEEPFMRFKSMQVRVLPNFYDPVLDEFDKCHDLKNKDPFEILYLSNIMKTKGIIELIDAFLLLSEKIQNIRLNIAGEFMNDDECSTEEIKILFYKKIKNISNIIYHGILKEEKKSSLLYNSSVFVLPSYYISEAFPLSIIEAMRTGCAIITTRHNYLGDIIKPKNGILVDIKDVDSLVDALERLITNAELLKNIQNNNITEAQDKYSLAKNLDSLRMIFNEK
jgi:glycosyltransferase involved in cell wall biosynthesis